MVLNIAAGRLMQSGDVLAGTEADDMPWCVIGLVLRRDTRSPFGLPWLVLALRRGGVQACASA
jgi:hypothetical protein